VNGNFCRKVKAQLNKSPTVFSSSTIEAHEAGKFVWLGSSSVSFKRIAIKSKFKHFKYVSRHISRDSNEVNVF
jgi:hypothetical protein